MDTLSISLLGSVRIERDGSPVGPLNHKSVALLAYLTVEVDRAHPRELLGNLLWPNSPASSASNSLRQALWQLRRALDRPAQPGVEYFQVEGERIRFNQECAYQLDLDLFRRPFRAPGENVGDVDAECRRLMEIVECYRGDFLEGFYVENSILFDDWVTLQRENAKQKALLVMHHLVSLLEASRQYELVQRYASRQLELDPYSDEAFRQLLRALVYDGKRSVALVQFERWRSRLKEDLGADPETETLALYAAIQEETFSKQAARLAHAQGGLPAPETNDRIAIPTISRPRELAALQAGLGLALGGQGRIACVSGEAGAGKSLLLQEFSGQAVSQQADLVLIQTRCSAFPDPIVPLMPFQEILFALCGDAPSPQDRETNVRAWTALPDVLRALVEHGPDLIDIFSLSFERLSQRAAMAFPAANPWVARLQALARRQAQPGVKKVVSSAVIFDQFTRVIRAVSANHPLLLTIDDLNWSDAESVSLLFHLAKRLSGARIFIVIAYRTEDHGAVGENAPSPLKSTIQELQRIFGEIIIDLDRSDGQEFVRACLDSLPNDFPEDFSRRILHLTGGNALFTVELLYNLSETGVLSRNAAGRWIEARRSEWKRLPARVEAIIARRLDSLPVELQAILKIASVVGEEFSVEVVAWVLGISEEAVLFTVQERLGRKYRLVQADRIRRTAQRSLAAFRFRHNLFRTYLYSQLDAVERERAHERIAAALESLCGWDGTLDPFAERETDFDLLVQLAYHYEEARLPERSAACYLQLGKISYRRFAFEQAAHSYRHALSLLEAQPNSAEAVRLKIELDFQLSDTMGMLKGWGADEQELYLNRAFTLSQERNTTAQLCKAVGRLTYLYYGRGDVARSLAFSQETLELGQRFENRQLMNQAYYFLGQAYTVRGDLPAAKQHLENFLNAPAGDRFADASNELPGIDPRSHACMSLGLVEAARGFPERAMRLSREGVQAARISNIPFAASMANLEMCLYLFVMHYPDSMILPYYEAFSHQVRERNLAAFLPWADFLDGRFAVAAGDAAGIERIWQAILDLDRVRSAIGRFVQWFVLLECCRESRQAGKGLEWVRIVLERVQMTQNRFLEPLYYQLQGDLLRLGGQASAEQVDESYRIAIDTARKIGAVGWELRACISRALLRIQQGQPAAARALLVEALAQFDGEVSAPDLTQARALLAQLGDVA